MTTVERRLGRAERRVEILEQMVEDTRRDAAMLTRDLVMANAELETTQRLMPSPLVVVDGLGLVVHVNRATVELLGYEEQELVGLHVRVFWPTYAATEEVRHDVEWRHRDASLVPVLLSLTRQPSSISGERLVCVALDLRARHRDEIARRHAQKLESLGQLSAGIAHEINTPMQFISDNLHVIERGYVAARDLLDRLFAVQRAARAGEILEPLLDAVDQAVVTSRWNYHASRQERAFARAVGGVGRVTEIVGAMKLFAHPGNELGPVDLDRALATTLTVANPELRNVATVTTSFGAVPSILGHTGDLNQVFLNLLVNAAHAIADAGRPELGRIAVRTRLIANHVEVAISDTGCGIPEPIQNRVYDPFFTTKAPGRGTGQGLALAHAIIVERHGGRIRFETGGSGTTFFVELPVQHLPGTP